jgi:hypothetical protein
VTPKHTLAALVLTLGTMAGGAAGPLPVDGTWVASSDGLGGELTIVIKTQGAAVTGEGLQGHGNLAAAPLTLSGTYRAPTLLLKLKSRDGLVWSLAAQVTGRETMSGTLTWPTGTVQTLAFVRP